MYNIFVHVCAIHFRKAANKQQLIRLCFSIDRLYDVIKLSLSIFGRLSFANNVYGPPKYELQPVIMCCGK